MDISDAIVPLALAIPVAIRIYLWRKLRHLPHMRRTLSVYTAQYVVLFLAAGAYLWIPFPTIATAVGCCGLAVFVALAFVRGGRFRPVRLTQAEACATARQMEKIVDESVASKDNPKEPARWVP